MDMHAYHNRHLSNTGSVLGILGADGSALQSSNMQAIPPDAYVHLEALKSYDDAVILYWLALLRGRTHNIPPTPERHTPRSLRSSYSSGNTRSSNASSLFSDRDQRISTSSWGTNGSHQSTFMSPLSEDDASETMARERLHHPSFPTEDDDCTSSYSASTLIPTYFGQPPPATTVHADRLPAARTSRARGGARDERYYCTSCDETFARKWDWKHHEEEFHERGRQWLCPDCGRDFYAENSFKKHHEKAHKCRRCPHAVDSLVPRERRVAWGCGICRALLHNWDERCEHVASHFEQGKLRTSWRHSNVVYALLHQEDIINTWREFVLARQREGAQMDFCWDKMVIKNDLEDLEYGRYPRNVEAIVRKAYELGIYNSELDSSEQRPLRASTHGHVRSMSMDKPLPRTPHHAATGNQHQHSEEDHQSQQLIGDVRASMLPPLHFDSTPMSTLLEQDHPPMHVRGVSEAAAIPAQYGGYGYTRANRSYSESNINDSFAEFDAEMSDIMESRPGVYTPLPAYHEAIMHGRTPHFHQ